MAKQEKLCRAFGSKKQAGGPSSISQPSDRPWTKAEIDAYTKSIFDDVDARNARVAESRREPKFNL